VLKKVMSAGKTTQNPIRRRLNGYGGTSEKAAFMCNK
jgi:hypothetical protein